MTVLGSLVQLVALTAMSVMPLQEVDPVIGAWTGPDTREGRDVQIVVIFTEAHQVAVWFDPENGDVVHTNGGLWSREGAHVTEVVEFDSDNPQRVGTSVSFDIELTDTELAIVGAGMGLTRIEDGAGEHLSGAWRVVESLDDGEWVGAEGPHRTVRLMSSTRFQEIVYNPETGELISTKGGTYVVDGQNYGERIEFWVSDEAPGRGARNMVQREGDRWLQMGRDGGGRAWQERPTSTP